jgi:hypothetical protein
MSWTPTKSMPPSPPQPPKRMRDNEFIALTRGWRRPPANTISRHHRQAAPGAEASAIHGRPGAQVALLQSPILPAAPPPYPHQRDFRNLPVDNTHTWIAIHLGVIPEQYRSNTGAGRGRRGGWAAKQVAGWVASPPVPLRADHKLLTSNRLHRRLRSEAGLGLSGDASGCGVDRWD